MNTNAQELMKRVNKAWDIKQQWKNLYDEAYSLAIPNRNTMHETTPGQNKNTVVYDSTLQQSTVRLASTLQSTIVPPFTEWATLTSGPFVFENKEEVNRKLEDINKTVFASLGISNFDTCVGEFLLDLCIGTGAMLVLDGDDDSPLLFVTVPISEIALEEGPYSSVGAIFRRYKKPARTIPAMWRDAAKCAPLDELIAKDGGKEVVIDELTYWDPDTDKWIYNVILDNISRDNKPFVLVTRKYTTNPWIICRWIKVSGETFGRGPVLNALADAKTVNMAKKLELQAASLAVSGVWLARNNGVINANAIKIMPGAVIPVRSTGGTMGADLTPLDFNSDVRFSQIVQADLHQNIKDAMFDRSIPDQGAVRSATEWIVRQQELQEAIGAPFGRMFSEFITPLYNRILDILYKRGIIQQVKVNGGVVKVQITGALAQAQNLKEVETVTNWAQTSIALVGPEVFQASAKVEGVTSYLGRLMGVDPQLVRTEEEKAELVQAAAMAIQKQPIGGTGTEPIGGYQQ